MSRPYTTDTAVRNYIDAEGIDSFGTDTLGTAKLAEKIVHADNIIDMTLSKRYDVPFVTTPPSIESVSTVMTAWWSLRSVYDTEIPAAVDFVKDDYEKAMGWLNELKTEVVDLPSGTSDSSSGIVIAEKGASGKYYSNNSDYYPVFDVDNSLNWKVDPDLITAIEGEKA